MRLTIIFFLCLLPLSARAQTAVEAQTIEKIDSEKYRETVVEEKSIVDLQDQCNNYEAQIQSVQSEIDRSTHQLNIIQGQMKECQSKLTSVEDALK